MPTRSIGHGWTLDLGAEFRERLEDAQHVFWSDGKTVYAVVYPTSGGDAESALAEMVRDRGVKPVERYDRADGAITGEAWLIPEHDAAREYWGLNTFTAASAGSSVACVTFYFEQKPQVAWARQVWSTVRPSVVAAPRGTVGGSRPAN